MSGESAILDRGQEYFIDTRKVDSERKHLMDRIKSLEQQASGHETIARGIRGELAVLKRQAGIAT